VRKSAECRNKRRDIHADDLLADTSADYSLDKGAVTWGVDDFAVSGNFAENNFNIGAKWQFHLNFKSGKCVFAEIEKRVQINIIQRNFLNFPDHKKTSFYFIDFDYEDLKRSNFFSETCEDSVPPAIFCFLISKNFEDCLRTTVSIGGDTDTLCAISCAIAEAYYKEIDEDLLKAVKQKINDLNIV
jgi:hypothetical protein